MIEIGPRSIPVMVMGDKVLGGTHSVFRDHGVERVGPRIFNQPIGHTSGLPFDSKVYDFDGRTVGRLEGGFGGIPTTLLKW